MPPSPAFRFDVISIFPEFFEPWKRLGVCGRAVTRGLVDLKLWNPRQFVNDPHQTIDDRPYGGGPGMVMMAAPLADAVKAIRSNLLTQGITGAVGVCNFESFTWHARIAAIQHDRS